MEGKGKKKGKGEQGKENRERRTGKGERGTGNGKNKLLVIGLGNTLMGDDGIGMVVARELALLALPGVRIEEAGTPGFGLLDYFSPGRDLLFIDAVDAGKSPGAVFWVEPAEIIVKRQERSLHQVGLGQVLALVPFLQAGPVPKIIGIQPASVEPRQGLSPRLEQDLPLIVSGTFLKIRKILSS